jgi:muramoyltetrapeptide carboxypeptidase
MFRDDSVRAIWAARGGSSASTLLPHLDYALMRATPKALVGYSDVTAVHLALLRHANLVSFHGPVSSSTFSDYNAAHLRAVLMDDAVGTRMPLREREPDAFPPEEGAPQVFRSGVAEGPLVGGNLSTLVALIGTPHMPHLRGCILFLEDVGEAPYRIDRMLTQLEQAGVFAQAAGVALGIFRKCTPPDDEPSLTLRQVFADRFASLRVPCAYGFPIGHIAQQLTLPLGVRARMDADARTITLLEPATANG